MKKIITLLLSFLVLFLLIACSGNDDTENEKCLMELTNGTAGYVYISRAYLDGKDYFAYNGITDYTLDSGATLGPLKIDAGEFDVTWKNCRKTDTCDSHYVVVTLDRDQKHTISFTETDPYYTLDSTPAVIE